MNAPTDLLDCIEIETAPNPTHAVIWLHGLGADGNDFAPIVPELDLPAGAAVRFVFPNAPVQRVTINNGMATSWSWTWCASRTAAASAPPKPRSAS